MYKLIKKDNKMEIIKIFGIIAILFCFIGYGIICWFMIKSSQLSKEER